MENWGSVEPDVSSIREADGFAALLDCQSDPRLADLAKQMRSPRDQERRIVGADIVEMDSQRHHFRENFERRNDVEETGLDGPRTKAGHVGSLANADDPILMPIK